MIRSSAINPHQPTREVTAQRYQAAVTPAPQKVSGVEKLLDFGMNFAKQKHQWNAEVMEAEVSMASEDYNNAIKTMQPAEFVKDPDAAMKSAGIDKLYEQIDKAPPGTQKLLRMQIDRMRDKTTASMTAAYNTQETVKAAVYNTSAELRQTGTLSDKNWDQVIALPADQQVHALGSVAQIAISEGHTAIFDKALNDPRINPELHDNILNWQRQAVDRQAKKTKEAAVEARRAQKEQADTFKAQQEGIQLQGALGSVAAGMPIGYVAQSYGLSQSKIEKAVAANPALHQKFLSVGSLSGDRALMETGLAHPVGPDGVTPSPAFKQSAHLIQQVVNARGGDYSRLEGELSQDMVRRLQRADLANIKAGGQNFTQALFTELTTTPNGGKYTDDAPARKALAAAGEGLTTAQQSALANEYDAHRSRGVSTAQALELAQETVTKGSSDFGGVTISDTNALKNNIGRTLGTEPTDASVKTVAMATVDRYLAAASQAYFGTNQPLPQWQQLGGMNGALTFRHVSGQPFITIPTDAFAKVAEEYQQNDAAFGMAPEQARVTNPEQFHMVGAGYPVGGAQ
ncbi:hypothetical protein D3C80_513840 [compost metagenome]